MTREEAIRIIKIVLVVAENFEIAVQGVELTEEKCKEAVDMAIKALKQEPCSDVISRQVVLDLPRIKTHNVWGNVICESVDVEDIRQLPSVKPAENPNKWIPVSERLPGKGEYGKVLVTYIPSGGTLWTKVIIAQYSDLMGIAKPSFYIGEVGKESFQNITEQVTAWMPLPEPYKASPTGAEGSE